MISKLLKQDHMLAARIILALTTGMMLTCSAKISFGQTPDSSARPPVAATTVER